jgi:NAD(P)-dependent dehydrogenase (short-subunit alcohol dehydrogenase family)
MTGRGWFKGRTALITGASRGIGRAIAERFADEGADLLITAANESLLLDVAAACRERGARVATLAGDLADPDVSVRLVATAVETFGSLDIVVNNAFWDETLPVTEASLEGWDRTLRVSLTAPMLIARAAIPAMVARGSGSIVNIGTMRAVTAGHGYAAYESAKAGLAALTRSIAIDYGARGVRCNCVNPGIIESERALDWLDGEAWRRPAMETAVPLGRIGRPEEVAAVVAFIASDEASFVNGVTLFVDGGAGASLPENAALELGQRAAEARAEP